MPILTVARSAVVSHVPALADRQALEVYVSRRGLALLALVFAAFAFAAPVQASCYRAGCTVCDLYEGESFCEPCLPPVSAGCICIMIPPEISSVTRCQSTGSC